ncbi:MAG TPA: serine hydrolase domain-containing protein [Longimicrobium sp.]|jgi:CubicO group peptidase (beta-lactamase class C family)
MKLSRSFTSVALLFLPTLAAAQAADSAARVDSLFVRWNSRETPGCTVGVGRGGRTLLTRAYGMADLEHDVPNTPETVFEAGSVSKQFTAAAVVLLAQQGRLSLDDPVRKHVPELPDYGAPLTVRHLLNHTSGLRDWGTVQEIAGWPRGTRTHTHAHVLDIAARQRALNFPPGSEYLYSNTGYNLLAVIVDRVAGEPFAEFTRRSLFQPLGMARTGWRDDFTRVVKGRAVAYELGRDSTFHSQMPFENVHGNGGLLTTVGDLLRWNENFADARVGGRVLVDELQRQGVLTSGRRIQYAEGLVVARHRGIPEVNHSGATAGYRAWLARYPEQRLSVAVLCNAAQANPVALGRRVADVFLPVSAAADAPAPVTLSAEALTARAGLYRNRRTSEPVRLAVRDGKLAAENAPPLVPLSATVFQAPSGWPRLEFDPAPAGRAALRLLAADGDTFVYDPVDDWAPGADRLDEFAGEYRSEEAEVAYTAAVEDGKLVLRRRPDARVELTPAYVDAFTAPRGWIVRFSRDASGRVDGLSVWLDRVRGLRFDRTSR